MNRQGRTTHQNPLGVRRVSDNGVPGTEATKAGPEEGF